MTAIRKGSRELVWDESAGRWVLATAFETGNEVNIVTKKVGPKNRSAYRGGLEEESKKVIRAKVHF